MTDKAKALPTDIMNLEQTPEFKAVDKGNTVEQLKTKLRDAGVTYLASDNKTALVWRYLDSVNSDAPKADTDSAVADDATDAESAANDDASSTDASQNADANQNAESQLPEKDSAPSQEASQEVSSPSDTTDKTDAPVNGDADNVADHEPKAPDTDSQSPEVAPENDKEVIFKTEVTDSGDKADHKDNDQGKPAKTDAEAPKEQDTPKAEPDYVLIKNTGAFNILEPASMTLIKAGKTEQAKIKGNVTRAAIIRNVEQFNRTRGNILRVMN